MEPDVVEIYRQYCSVGSKDEQRTISRLDGCDGICGRLAAGGTEDQQCHEENCQSQMIPVNHGLLPPIRGKNPSNSLSKAGPPPARTHRMKPENIWVGSKVIPNSFTDVSPLHMKRAINQVSDAMIRPEMNSRQLHLVAANRNNNARKTS